MTKDIVTKKTLFCDYAKEDGTKCQTTEENAEIFRPPELDISAMDLLEQEPNTV